MAKVSLRASGGLNKDYDPNNLPQGDYASASNILFDSGKSGGAGAIRLMESILDSGITIVGIKESFQDVDGSIYVLADNGSLATIYKIPTTLDSSAAVVSYVPAISGTVIPDLKIIGKNLVWNYAESGTVLSFSLSEAFGTTQTIANLKLAKATPNNVVSVQKTLGSGLDFLEANDFQFASRYQYKDKGYSVLSNYSQIFKGEKGTESYSLAYNFASIPAFAENLEVYARIGNNGVWRRIDTQIISEYTTAFTWVGQTYETLDTITTGKPFDAIPVSAKHIEVAKNRIFLGNIKDDYEVTTANLNFTLTTASGYTLPSGGLYNSYITGSPLTTPTSSEISYGGSDYVKPFANDSTYAVGLAYYDAALKTRGVEKYVKFNTGKFTYPIIPNVTITFGGAPNAWVAPTWAKYAQLVYTKNLNKSYFYEGYASNIFFELAQKETNLTTKEVTEIKVNSQSITDSQINDVKYLVVDLMGMYRAGKVYVFQDGDRINLKTPNGVLNLRILAQENTFIYCEYASATSMTNPALPVPKDNYFEIYTKRQIQEDETLVFYEYGNMMDISGWATTPIVATGAGTVNNASAPKLIGDTVFSKIEVPVYKTSPFLYNTQRTVPAVDGAGISTDVVTVVNGTVATFQSSIVGAGEPTPRTQFTTFTNLGTNGDGASLIESGKAFKVAGFYDIGNQEAGVNKITVDYNLTLTKTLVIDTPALGDPFASMTYSLYAQLYKTPYDNIKNEYAGVAEKIGISFPIFPQQDIFYAANAVTETNSGQQVIQLSTGIAKNIEANDKFHIEFTLYLKTVGKDVNTAIVSISQNGTYGTVVTLNGDRTLPKIITTYNKDVEIDSTQVKYLTRSVSNATSNQYWNTSTGKPLFLALSKTSNTRTNTIRYGGNYVAGTNINDISSFFSLDSNDVPIENGEITSIQRASRLQGNGAMLLVLCQKESSYIMLGEQELSQGNNASVRSLTANMIGTIRNFNNNLGMQDKGSVMNYKGNIWWWDNFNKKVIKYTPDGLEIPSDTYMRSYFLNKSGVATFSYDPFYNMCFVGIGNDTTSIGYSDNLKRWIAEYSFRSEHAESYGDKILIFKSNKLYKPVANNITNDYNNLVGTSVNGSIEFTVNSRLPMNPLNVAVWHDMNVIDWGVTANYVKASLMTIGITNENGQSTSIVESNFLMEDNRLYAHVMRDANSRRNNAAMTNAIIEGDYIVGYLNKFVVTLKDKTQTMRINSIDVELAPVSGHS